MRTDGLRSRESWLWLPVRMQEPGGGRSPRAWRGSPTPDPSPPRPNISVPETACGEAAARGQRWARAGPRTQARPAPSQPALRASLPSRDPHSKSGDYVKAVTNTWWKFMPKLMDFVRHPMTRKALQENHPSSCRAVRPQCSSRPARTAGHRPTLPPGAPGQPSCVHGHLRTQGSRSADGHFRDTPRP